MFFGSAAKDFTDFCIATDKNYDPQWFHEEIARALEAVERGEIKRLMVEMPPRHGKSEEISVKFPAWLMGRHPDWPVINASYSSTLSEKHSGECRDIVRSPAFQAIFPGVVVKGDTAAKDFWQVQHGKPDDFDYLDGGGYQAVGVGGAATGFGARVLIVDDPVKNREEADSEVMREKVWGWFSSVARTRLEKDGAVIVVMTRWHEDDLAGRLLATGQKWHRIRFPAIAEEDEPRRKAGEALWVERYPLAALQEIKADTDDRTWFALYQQSPRLSSSQNFNPDWFKTFKPAELEKVLCNRYATLDMADSKKDKADFTGLTVVDWAYDDKWYVRHVKRHKMNVKEKIDMIFWIWDTWRPLSIGIEQKAFEDQLKPLFDDECLRRGKYPVVVPLEHRGRAKEARILGALQGRAQLGRVWLQAEPLDDTEKLKEEMWSFPRGRFDDLLDALAYIEDIGQRPFLVAHSSAAQITRRRSEDVSWN